MISIKVVTLFAIIVSVCCQKDPLVAKGRSVMTHLFEWKWADIALECERFLGPKGYGAVQVSPPNEHAVINSPYFRPWWQRYQPVSYKLNSRSGNEEQFKDMVSRCNAAGVRIYVDAIINHMSREDGFGSGSSPFSGRSKSFPGVPYGPNDFNDNKCSSQSGNIEDYGNADQVRNCKLERLPDLNLEMEYVRERIVEYLNNLIDIGVAGFRIDAAKHMFPSDINSVVSRLNNVRADVFGANRRPYIYQEVIDLGGEPIKNTDYSWIGRVTEFKYGQKLSEVVYKSNGQKMSYLKNFGEAWGFLWGDDSLAFIDNHDNQRGHGAGGPVLTFFDFRNYKIGNAFMLAWPYGLLQVMSSYRFDLKDTDQGPPRNEQGETNDVIVKADDSCDNGWVCEHRWRQIYNMVGFRNVAGMEEVRNWWDNGENQIAFSRGKKAFIAINNDNYPLKATLRTGLPAGNYCDIISGNKINGACTGKIITVFNDSSVIFDISNMEEDPIVAFHIDSRL